MCIQILMQAWEKRNYIGNLVWCSQLKEDDINVLEDVCSQLKFINKIHLNHYIAFVAC